ncbi:MAG: hypothetical protein DLM50_04805 [Candidatus Meridianibacter frigidus]|nr:MAG: hypothetical protein DLM50_04805 [Candidatus Eremiobacteraeota bacterium]
MGAARRESTSPPTAHEARFIAVVARDLSGRFPTVAQARRAGYFRYTMEDSAGIIAYANLHWNADPRHPSQLWFDERGRLIGADFSQYVHNRTKRPVLWQIDPVRWTHFFQHVHFGLRSGNLRYGAIYVEKFRAAGGNPEHPSAAPIIRLGLAKSTKDVRFVFTFPELWVLSFWVIPNPRGAFAETNPNVPTRHKSVRNPHLPL